MNTETINKPSGGRLSLPIAIVVAGALIAGAILITKAPAQPAGQAGSGYNTAKLAAVKADEHILGAGPDNKVFLIEFSDTECPFCKVFHATAHRIVDDYGGQVAWAYRHFPLSFHDRAKKEAEATECAAQLGGNDAFWKYLDRIFEITPANNGLDPMELYNIAQYVGLNDAAFADCLESGKGAARVEADMAQATAVGVSGTPLSFLVYKKQIVPIEGAEPYESVKAKIDALLK